MYPPSTSLNSEARGTTKTGGFSSSTTAFSTYDFPSDMIFVFILAPTSGANAVCFFKLLTSCSSSALRFCSCSTARSSFWRRSDSEAVCAPSRGAASKTIAARLTPAARKTNFLVNIRFLLLVVSNLRDSVLANTTEARKRLLQRYGGIVTIRQTLLSVRQQPWPLRARCSSPIDFP